MPLPALAVSAPVVIVVSPPLEKVLIADPPAEITFATRTVVVLLVRAPLLFAITPAPLLAVTRPVTSTSTAPLTVKDPPLVWFDATMPRVPPLTWPAWIEMSPPVVAKIPLVPPLIVPTRCPTEPMLTAPSPTLRLSMPLKPALLTIAPALIVVEPEPLLIA